MDLLLARWIRYLRKLRCWASANQLTELTQPSLLPVATSRSSIPRRGWAVQRRQSQPPVACLYINRKAYAAASHPLAVAGQTPPSSCGHRCPVVLPTYILMRLSGGLLQLQYSTPMMRRIIECHDLLRMMLWMTVFSAADVNVYNTAECRLFVRRLYSYWVTVSL